MSYNQNLTITSEHKRKKEDYILSIIIYIILLAIYFRTPLPIMVITFLANIFIPDPIPVFDEVIMILGLLSKIDAMEKVFNVIEKIKNFLGGFFKVIVVIILALCIWGIIAYFT